MSTQARDRATRHPVLRLLVFLLLLTLGAVVLALVLFLLHFPPQRRHGELQPWPLLFTGILACGLVLSVTRLCLHRMEGRALPTVGLPIQRSRSASLVGLGLGALVPVLVTLFLYLGGQATVIPTGLTPSLVLNATLPMLGATVLLAGWEELAFRGYPLQALIAWGGPWWGATVTGILFGLAHSGNPGVNVLGLVTTAVNGILLAWVVIRTGSLWLAWGYHAGWNIAAAQLLGLVDSGIHAPGAVLRTQLEGPTWLTGGPYGFEGSALTAGLEAVLLGLLVQYARRLPSAEAAKAYFAPRQDAVFHHRHSEG